ncbi:MAG TPA: response regulator transcription factor [Bellilinea sp.]|nr:response regulator transcription factor [Bellilinea sp.]
MIKVLICDDQEIVSEGLNRILGHAGDIEVIGTASNGEEALEQVKRQLPDVVLMDLKMPLMNGIQATRKIKEKWPQVQVLVLTTFDEDEWLFDAIRSGASGYLLKDLPREELFRAIRGTAAGQNFLDPMVAGKIMQNVAQNAADVVQPSVHISLSEREQEVLDLMAEGLSNADIAGRLYLSEGTVRNYSSSILNKLSVSDRTQAVVVALRYGLVKINRS